MPANYTNVNSVWPDNPPVPTPQEALAGAKRLHRLAMGKAWKGKWALTSGRRHTQPRYGIYYVNPDRQGWSFNGWKDIVHAMSHHAARRLYPKAKPHDHRHAYIERTLAEHVVKSGWLEGKLKRPEKPQADAKQIKYERTLAKIKAWEAKQKRAKNALRKLSATRAYYERVLQQ